MSFIPKPGAAAAAGAAKPPTPAAAAAAAAAKPAPAGTPPQAKTPTSATAANKGAAPSPPAAPAAKSPPTPAAAAAKPAPPTPASAAAKSTPPTPASANASAASKGGSNQPPTPAQTPQLTAASITLKAAPPPELVTFADGSFVFIPDANECYVGAKASRTFKQGDAAAELTLLSNNKTVSLSSAEATKQCLPMDSQSLDAVEDMVNLRQLNEASILHNLRMRFYVDDIYTTIGNILVSVNPFKTLEIYTPNVMEDYMRRRLDAPHVFRLADEVFRAVTDTRKSQSCIVAGESGAGKTEATKLFLKYLAEVTSSAKNANFGGGDANVDDAASAASGGTRTNDASVTASSSAATDQDSSLQDRVLEANPLMEAFGNAKTVRNDNSSRFGKWIAVTLDTGLGRICGGSITSYLLERTRVVNVAEGERGYHIFYQICAAAALDKSLRAKFHLSPATDFAYLNQSPCVIVETINDTRHWQQTSRAMEVVGIGDRRGEVVSVVAGILHVGNVYFDPSTDAASIVDRNPLSFAAECFGVAEDALERAIVKRDVSIRGEAIYKDLTRDQATMARDALSKTLYSLLFDWLLHSINKSLGADESAAVLAEQAKELNPPPAASPPTIKGKTLGTPVAPAAKPRKPARFVVVGVLDIFGFESFAHNSFEQLCINYCNEKLQSHFNEHVFLLEQSIYQAEGLDVSKIEFKDNSAMIALLESKPKGLFFQLDEENALPHGSDDGYLRKVYELAASSPDGIIKKPEVALVRQQPRYAAIFVVQHYAGPVEYTVTGFLEKNKDDLPPEISALLKSSSLDLIQDVVDLEESGALTVGPNSFNETGSAASGAGGARRRSTKNNAAGGGGGGAGNTKKQSVSSKFKDQLTTLMETLHATEPHFVRCVKPNAAKVSDEFTSSMVLAQLRYSGLLEVCRIRKNGYPIRKTFSDFAFRYAPLCTPQPKRGDHLAVCSGLERASVVPERKQGGWQVGKTQIFLRIEIYNQLESAREDMLRDQACAMQKVARGFVQRRRFRKYKGILKQLGTALGSNDEAKMERALLEAGSLPYTGVHLDIVQRVREALARLRAQERARGMVRQACAARVLASIEVALDAATSVGLDISKDQTCVQAASLAGVIRKENACRQALRDACAARDLAKLDAALETAVQLGMESSPEADEARVMKRRVETVNRVATELEQAIKQGASEESISRLVSTLVELGARDHPMVAEGERAAKRAAEVSAAHAKRLADCKRRVLEAAAEEDLDALVQAESLAVELGLDRDRELAPKLALRPVLEKRREIATGLRTQVQALQVKSETSEGVTSADVDNLSNAVDAALKEGLKPTDEAAKRATDFVALARKQVLARAKLEEAIRAGKEKKDEDGLQIKAAMDEAISLGMQDETARRGQAALQLKSATVENRRERRASTMMMNDAVGMGAKASGPLTRAMGGRGSVSPGAPGSGGGVPGISSTGLKVLMKATNEERQKQCVARMKAANSASFRERMASCVDNDNFSFERFMRLRSDEDFTEHDPVAKKRKNARRKCKHANKVIPKSLLQLEGVELNEEAINIHKSILGWAGDASAQFPAALAQSVLRAGQTNDALKDEIYAQLLKQVSDNPDVASEERTWVLACLCAEHFAPTNEFVNYVLHSLLRVSPDPGMVGNYARWCLFQLGATLQLGSSPYSLPMKEIDKYTERPPVLLRVHQVFRVVHEHMTWTDVPVWPDQDVGFVERMLASQLGLGEEQTAVSGLFLKDIPIMPEGFSGSGGGSGSGSGSGTSGRSGSSPSRRPPNSVAGGLKEMDVPEGDTVAPLKSPLSGSGESNSKSSRSLRANSRNDDDDTQSVMSTSSRKSLYNAGVTAASRLRRSLSRKNVQGSGTGNRLANAVKSFLPGGSGVLSPTSTNGALANGAGLGGGGRGGGASGSSKSSGGGGGGSNDFITVGSASSVSITLSAGLAESLGMASPAAATAPQSEVKIDMPKPGGGAGAGPNRVPPPPFAPWPLPRSFFLGDVFLRLVKQERLPFLTYQRKIFVREEDIVPDKYLYVQVMQDVVNNRLPIASFDDIVQLAVVGLVRSVVSRGAPLPPSSLLVEAGVFNYIPASWAGAFPMQTWVDATSKFLTDWFEFFSTATEDDLTNQYIAVAKVQPLFGAALFSVIRKDAPGDFVAAVNFKGLHVLTNDGSPQLVGTVPFSKIQKLGASSTFVWVSVDDETKFANTELFPAAGNGILYLLSQQAKELYQLLLDYAQVTSRGVVKF